MSPHEKQALIDLLDKELSSRPPPSEPGSSTQADRSGTDLHDNNRRGADLPGTDLPDADDQIAATRRLIGEDEAAAREWSLLHLAVDAIRDAGLHEQVAEVRRQWQTAALNPQTAVDSSQPLTPQPSTINPLPPGKKPAGRSILRTLFPDKRRVAAACLLLLIGGILIFKYIIINSPDIYNKYYTPYELNTSRGDTKQDAIDQAYTAKNWTTVLSLVSASKKGNNKSDFLAGMADLELKKFDDAIGHFEQIIAINSQTGSDYFEDEAEYYLAMSWLAKGKVNEAMPMLEKIRANKSHLYHEKVRAMSFFGLRLIQYKENK